MVNNSVIEIRTLTKTDYWRYISSKDNHADLVMRELLPRVIVNND